MSSQRVEVAASKGSVLGSSVFRRALLFTIASLLVLLTLVWLFNWAARENELDALRADLNEMRDRSELVLQEDGMDALIAEIARDGEPVWETDALFSVMEEEQWILRLVNAQDETLAGYPGMDPPGGLIDWTFLDHPDLGEEPIIVSRGPIDAERELIIARFIPAPLVYAEEVMRLATIFLILAVIPIAIVSAYFTSRTVFRRLDTVTTTTSQIGHDRIDARIPLSPNGDEFDRLAGGVNDMLDRIAALTRNLEGITVGVAHDIKTPISNIAGRLQLIERDAGDSEAVGEHVQIANEHIGSLLRTLDALLRLGQIESGARREAFTRFDLSELTIELAESFEPLFDEADQSLESRIADSQTINGDRNLIAQLITNLLENALEHARDGARVWIELTATDEAIQLVVGDDGPGLPENRANDIFERFVRMDPGRTKAGNGLGLALVKSIATLHDGEAKTLATHPGLVIAVSFPSA